MTIIRLLLTVFCLLLATWSQPRCVHAHPHGFLEATVSIVFDKQGMAGVRQRWVIDSMTTWAVFELIEENGDGRLDEEEVAAIERESFESIKGYNFFTAMRIDGQEFPVEWATDFDAFLEDGKLVYTFFIPCHVAAPPTPRQVRVAVFDPSFFVFVAYVEEGSSGVDPTQDPLFGNRAAGASPDDYERFTEATGLGKYTGSVQLEGPVERFDIETEVVQAPEMRYFYDQIVPQAFQVRFSRK